MLPALLLVAAAASSCRGPSSQEVALVRLHQLREMLLSGNDNLSKANATQFQQMETQVHATGMRPPDVAVLSQGRVLHDSTHALAGYLRNLREELSQRTRERDLLAQLGTRGAVGEIMQAQADRLQLRLSRHAQRLQQIDPPHAAPSAPNAEAYALSPFDFGNTTLAGAQAALARYETVLLLQEEAALARLSAKLTPSRLRAAFHAMATAEKSVVRPGDTYRAQVRLAQVRYQPGALAMKVNGRTIPVGPDGIGQVELSTAVPGQGRTLQAFWEGSITVSVSRRDSTFRLRVPYTVVK
ncbi:hypothetical protein ACFST9_12545 [Hymenobacter monticola]|uniref:Gliding motility-associated protein GldM first immunoglobulin-like domain-containing protein n=1 Tax=Hymenobacter monticola TaxID=1705399 RepID=A0ABY4B735_9BACT|nr:hypothetical protein [Hymenobacter monticola]UOE34984.1 hypothetical protein MTP16_04865 [Hymenobacter monticola]